MGRSRRAMQDSSARSHRQGGRDRPGDCATSTQEGGGGGLWRCAGGGDRTDRTGASSGPTTARAPEPADAGEGAAGPGRGARGHRLLPQPAARLPRREQAQPTAPSAAAHGGPAWRPAELQLRAEPGRPALERRGLRRCGAALDRSTRPNGTRCATSGAEFDADGDGVAEQVYYNGFRAGDDVVLRQRSGRRSCAARRTGAGQAPGHREHGRDLRPGSRRPDRPARRRSARSAASSATTI